MKNVLTFDAVADAATGMALPIVPSLVGRLSFGKELTRRRRGGLCLPEKDPQYPKCISPDLSAILIQKDDAKAQGNKSESTPEESGYLARPALVRKRMLGHPLKGS
jgi:hypothetical protein